MSKYVIELRPDCKVVQQICETNGQVCIGARSIQYLEELTADYIKRHTVELRVKDPNTHQVETIQY